MPRLMPRLNPERCLHSTVELDTDRGVHRCLSCGTTKALDTRTARTIRYSSPGRYPGAPEPEPWTLHRNFTYTLLGLLAVTFAVALWVGWVEGRDAKLEAVDDCARAAIAGQDWTQAQYRAAWDACWPTNPAHVRPDEVRLLPSEVHDAD